MLGLIANFMGDLGKQLIAVGVARSRSKAFANPFVAVAAGVALVALSSIFRTPKAGPKNTSFRQWWNRGWFMVR
jgi:hypothetical protein